MSCCTDESPTLFGDAWPIDGGLVAWILEEARARGLRLDGARNEDGAWISHEPASDPGGSVWISQRPGCAGVRTALLFTDGEVIRDAWYARRPLGQPEPVAWQALLTEALVHSARKEVVNG